MNWNDANKKMDEGSMVRRAAWDSAWMAYKTAVKIKGDVVEYRLNRPGDMHSTWEPQPVDMEATDWELVPTE